MIAQNHISFPIYIPRVCRLLKNWPLYLFNYLSRSKKPARYCFRDGYSLIDGTGTLAGTIAVVFIRREYGLLQKFRTIVDIGANMGSFAVYAAQNCPDATIFCYEPQQENFEFLTRNILANSLEYRVSAFKCAVASTSEQRKIGIAESPTHSLLSSTVGTATQTVRCTTLNEIIVSQKLKGIDFLKINCEGAEYEILESCSRADFDRILNIRLEYHNLDGKERNGAALARFLENRGFKISRLTRYREKAGLFPESGFLWASRT